MKIIREPNYNPDLSLALGFFDGVHKAHKILIEKAVNFAKENNTKSGVITFSDNPLSALGKKDINSIYSNDDKYKIIEDLGVDFLYSLDFKKYINMSAEDYLGNVLVKNFKPKYIVTGFNHYFGKNKAGNCDFLENSQKKYGYTYEKVLPVKIGSTLISTTNIKKMLSKGNIPEANLFLGRDFWIKGKIEKGNNVGESLGFRTANLTWPLNTIKLPYGVYKTECFVNGKIYQAISNWGICPTLNLKRETLEVHILDFSDDIYNEEITVFFKEKIRDEKKFTSKEALIAQIKKDLEVF